MIMVGALCIYAERLQISKKLFASLPFLKDLFQRKYIKSDFGKKGINKKLKKASSLNGKVNVINKHYIRPYNLKRENKACYKYAKKYYDGRSKLK